MASSSEAGNDGQQSLRAGHVIPIATPKSIADGALTTHLGELTFPIIRKHVTDIVTVSDAQLVDTMKFFAERMKMVVEPTGCLGAAAALQQVVRLRDARVGVIIGGGNVDLKAYAGLPGFLIAITGAGARACINPGRRRRIDPVSYVDPGWRMRILS